jgi:hypothetical protein
MHNITEHKHRFAAWAASRASSVKGCRFKVEKGKSILDNSSLKQISNIDALPNPEDFDKKHKEWRMEIIELAGKQGLNNFTHGIAAKLINIYLKTIFVCGGFHDNVKVMAIHPPVDEILLKGLAKENVGARRKVWIEARKNRWSKFNSSQYEKVIINIKDSLPKNTGLWSIEEYWKGFQ